MDEFVTSGRSGGVSASVIFPNFWIVGINKNKRMHLFSRKLYGYDSMVTGLRVVQFGL